MSFISRILFHNSSLFKFNKRATNVIQKLSLSQAHYICSNHPRVGIEPKDHILSTLKRFLYSVSYIENHKKPPTYMTSKLRKVNLSAIVQNAENLPEGLLIATFQKLSFIYHKNKDKLHFRRELNYFTKTNVFQNFCQILEKKLHRLTPPYLSCLLDLVHFNISPESVIMRKIYTLILDNINFFPVFDLISLHCQLQQNHFRNIPECKSILEGCENFFENHLEKELSCGFNDIKIMTDLISEEAVPLLVKRLFTEKCLNLIESNHYNLTAIPVFFLVSFKEPIFSLYKTELLDKFKLILETHRLPKVQEIFSFVYRKIVQKNDAAYDEEICKLLIESMSLFYSDKSFVKSLSLLCEIGYYDQQSVEKAVDFFMSVNLDSISPFTVLNSTLIFVDLQIHQMNNPHWSKIKTQLESYNATKSFTHLSNIFQWCEYLSFLGCDTTPLISQIIKKAEEISETSKINQSILRLHRVIKKYFPDSNLEFNKKFLANCLQNSVYKKDFYVNSHVHKFFGGENYVLEDCLSPDYVYLPMVAVLGPDNKPIDLSSYKNKDKTQIQRKSFNVILNIEHIERPSGSKVIAFVEYPNSRPFKYRNAPITSGYLQMFLKPYEGLNCHIVPLPQRYFYLKDDEKLKFLSSEVNKIIESSDTMFVKNEV